MHPLRRLFQHAGAYRRQVLVQARLRFAVKAAVVGMLVPTWAHAEGVTSEPPALVQFRLPNGLDVILEEDDRQPRVAVMVGYDVGQRDDPPGMSGLAHLVEHLTYRRSRHLPTDFAGMNLLQQAGATSVNGFTTPDFTYYQEVVPSDALELALFVESERMAFSLEKFTSTSVHLEQDIIWREAQLRAANPMSALERATLSSFFGEGHPYYQAPDATQLDHVNLSVVRNFFQQAYRPDNAHLILVGDFEIAPTRALVEQYFGPIVAPLNLERPRPARGYQPARSFVLRDYGDVDELRITWAAPAPGSDAAAASLLFARQLRRNVDAALAKTTWAAARVYTSQRRLDDATLLSVHIQVDTDIDAAARTFEAELRRIWKTDWAKELPRLQREALLDHRLENDSPLDLAEEHLISTRTLHHPFDARAFDARLSHVTPAQMRALAAWFSGKQAMVGWFLHVNGQPERRISTGLSVVPR